MKGAFENVYSYIYVRNNVCYTNYPTVYSALQFTPVWMSQRLNYFKLCVFKAAVW